MLAWKVDIIIYAYNDCKNTEIEDEWNCSYYAIILVQIFFLMDVQNLGNGHK